MQIRYSSVKWILPVLAAVILALGCSSAKSPITPQTPAKSTNNPDLSSIAISDISDGKISGGMGTLGLFLARINQDTLSGEFTTLRSAKITDSFESVDITSYLTSLPCSDCVVLNSIGLNNNKDLVLTIGIRHPYGSGNSANPISAKNRADLHVFNVEGTIIGNSGESIQFPASAETVDAYRLLNADGYSKYMDASIDSFYPTVATIHPYRLHFDSYDAGNYDPSTATGFTTVTYPLPSGNLVMPMGSDYDFKDYIFRHQPGHTLNFIFAVNCSFGLTTATFEDRFEPVYRVPQFNKKAASEIDVSMLEYNLVPGDTNSTVKIEVRILDINHGVSEGTALNQMAHDSSVKMIGVEVPGMMTSPMIVNDPVPESGDGHSPSSPLVYEITLQNTAGGTDSVYPALVKVVDSYPTGANTIASIAGKDGIKRLEPGASPIDGLFEISEFATYQAFLIKQTGTPPDCDIQTDPSPAEIEQGESLTLDGSGSSDDNYIESYEWDLDYDGSNFDADDSGPVITVFLCETGTFEVALRITDNDANWVICTVPITINPDTSAISGWGDDEKILGNTSFEPFIVNSTNRSIMAYEESMYIVMNSNLPENKSENIYFMRSDDKGSTWTAPIQVTNYPDTNKAWTREANLAIDRQNGDIYVQFESDAISYQTNQTYKMDVFITVSHSNGDTWALAQKVNPETAGQSDEFAGSVAVDDSVTPSWIYVAYENRASSSDYNIIIANAKSDSLTTWTAVKVDDTSAKAMHPSVYVNPVDYSVNVAWVNPKNLGGTGAVLFDRSTDNGTTWETDISIFNINSISGSAGPFETCLAIQPTSGIPGVMWRDLTSGGSKCTHRFAKATSETGASWGEAKALSDGSTQYCWAGTLTVTPDGQWAAVFEQDKERQSKWYAMFTDSLDDGETWSTPARIDDTQASDAGWVFGLSMALDECKTAYVIWLDERADQLKNELYFDHGT